MMMTTTVLPQVLPAQVCIPYPAEQWHQHGANAISAYQVIVVGNTHSSPGFTTAMIGPDKVQFSVQSKVLSCTHVCGPTLLQPLAPQYLIGPGKWNDHAVFACLIAFS